MNQLYFVRHCTATGQSPDAPLTSAGEEQAERLAAFLMGRKIGCIISSPFRRALQSIEPFARRAHLHVHVDIRLAERVLSTTYLANWMDCLKDTFTDFDLVYEGGESSRAAMERGVATIEDVLHSDEQPAVIVTHGNLMTLLLKHFDRCFGFEQWNSLTNPDVFLITLANERSTVERVWE